MTPRRIAIAVAAACIAGSGQAEVLSLHAAWHKAVASEPAWRMAQADASIDQEDSNKARAGLLPQIGISGSRNQNSLTQTGTSTTSTSYSSSSTSLSLRQPLFRMQSYSEYQRANAKSAGAEFRLGNEAQSLAVRVAQAYFEVLLGEDAIRFSSYLEKSLTTHVDAARKAFRNGTGTRIDIDEARARLAMATADRQAAENASANAKKRLSAIVGMPVTDLIPLDEERVKTLRLTPPTFAEWQEIARSQNPELAAAAKAVDEASWSVTTARSGHLPTVDLVMSRSKAESDTVSTINSGYTANAVGVQLNIPLFSGGYTSADTTQAAARHQRAIAARENTERQLETRVLQEFNGVLQGEERLTSLATAHEASLEALRSTRHGVAAGTRTSLDVLNAERQLYSTRLDISKARYEWLMSRMRLQALAGKLDEAEIKEVSALLSLSARRDPVDTLPAETAADKPVDRQPAQRDSIFRVAQKREAEIVAVPKPAPALIEPRLKASETTSAPTPPQDAPTTPQVKAPEMEKAAEAPPAAVAVAAADGAEKPGAIARVGTFLTGLFAAKGPPAPKDTAAPVESAPAQVVEIPAAASTEPTATPTPVAAAEPVVPVREPQPAVEPPPVPASAVAESQSAKVAPAVLAPVTRSAPIIPPKNSGAYVVALGTYGNVNNVLRLLSSADKMGVAAYTETIRDGLTRVRAGPFATRQAARKALDTLSAGGVAGVLDKR